ncbi:hypothetical protein D3C85_783270 [compost metagenome]
MCQGRAPGVDLVQALQLHQGNGGIDVGQVVLEAWLDHLRLGLAAVGQAVVCVHAQAMKLEHAHPVGQRFVVADEHRPFGTGHVLDGVKGKDRRAPGPYGTSAITGAGRMGGVFDDRDTVPVPQGIERIEVEGRPGVMHRNNGLGARGNGRCDGLDIGHQGISVDVDEDRGCAQQTDNVGGGYPGLRGRDHFVAGADPQCQQRDMHAAGGRRQCHGVLTAHVPGKLLLKFLVLRSGGDPARAQYLLHGSHFFSADTWARKGQKFLGHGGVGSVIVSSRYLLRVRIQQRPSR